MANNQPFANAPDTPRDHPFDGEIVYVVVEMTNRIPQGVYTSLFEAAKVHHASWEQLTPWHWTNGQRCEGRLEVTKFYVNRGLKK
jgi:hypothetical protein